MSWGAIALAVVFGVPVIVFLAVRFGSAAYFKSKQQFSNPQQRKVP